MPVSFLSGALLAISVATNLSVEAIKKFCEEFGVDYSANVLAAIISVVMTFGYAVCYVILCAATVTFPFVLEMIVLAYCSFLVSTLGYDKVMQAIDQIRGISDGMNKIE